MMAKEEDTKSTATTRRMGVSPVDQKVNKAIEPSWDWFNFDELTSLKSYLLADELANGLSHILTIEQSQP
jgi:hypothetical protein